ncbi:MAG: NAD(P)/FAD-dependent oxidoreductase [Paracoccaceae bacterium]
MPFETTPLRHIAVVGAGITGLGAARRLARHARVTLIEAGPDLGGHARTRMGGPEGDQPVDTGFIVYNEANYPHLTALFDDLGVETVPSNMSFGASLGGGAHEYGLAGADAFFAQRMRALDPRHWRMLRDILRFNARAWDVARANPDWELQAVLDHLGMGAWFRERYLTPFTGAIWSTPRERMMEFPALSLLRFMRNHNLLQTDGQHPWRTVAGGSRRYVAALEAGLRDAGVEVLTGAPVLSLARDAGGVDLRLPGGTRHFDEVVLATHSDDSLGMLADADGAERAILGAIRYRPNDVVLHSDPSQMPRSRRVWSSWNYAEGAGGPDGQIDLTYWMNSLQPWLTDVPLFVTLNARRDIDPALVWDRTVLRHPVFDAGALEAQGRLGEIQGRRGVWFCGAWARNGFHEDGLATAMEVCADIEDRARLAAAE